MNTEIRLPRGQFKCYHCRLLFAQKDGSWFDWETMQVHLCKTCNKLTERRPERKQASSASKSL